MTKILEPFKIASDILQGSKYPTLSYVYPIIMQLRKKLTEVNTKTLKDTLEKACENIDERWKNIKVDFFRSSL